jgi:hypothetical protein
MMYPDLRVMEVPLHFPALLHPSRIGLGFHCRQSLHGQEPSETPTGYAE